MSDQTCNRCEQAKPATEFYSADRTCKVCRCALVRKNRAANVDYYRDYDRQRTQTQPRREHLARNCRKFRSENPVEYAAHAAVGNAVRDGRLKKEPCVVCKSDNVHAHHEDYSKPLAVIWLCPEHHQQYHLIRRVAEKVGEAA
jgi:hypothetical protein